MKNKILSIIVYFIIPAIAATLIWSTIKYSNNSPVKGGEKIVYVPVTDTVTISDEIHIINLERKVDVLNQANKELGDSINIINDKLDKYRDSLFVAYYKLNRIKEYNRIAGKNNNLKFLRGWINRVLE